MTTNRLDFAALALGAVLAGAAFAVSPAYAEEEGSSAPKATSSGYPTSVESMIERRREAMERRRDDFRDLLTGRRWRQPPWIMAQRDWTEQRRDLMDERFRRLSDAQEQRSDAWGRWMHPWSQWRQDRSDARRDAYELNRLYRDEFYDRAFYDRPFGPRFW